MPIPLGRAFAALARALPKLLAIALCSAAVFFSAMFAGLVEARRHVSLQLVIGALSVLLVILHAVYLVAASRVVAASSKDRITIARLPMFGWVRAIVSIVVFVAAVAAAFTIAIKFLTPFPPSYAVVMATIAVVAWTPFLPILAVENRSFFAAVSHSAPDLGRFVWCGVWTSLPFPVITGLLVFPILGSKALSFGLFEGGVVAFPLLGLSLFAAVTTMTLVPTVVYAAIKPDVP